MSYKYTTNDYNNKSESKLGMLGLQISLCLLQTHQSPLPQPGQQESTWTLAGKWSSWGKVHWGSQGDGFGDDLIAPETTEGGARPAWHTILSLAILFLRHILVPNIQAKDIPSAWIGGQMTDRILKHLGYPLHHLQGNESLRVGNPASG